MKFVCVLVIASLDKLRRAMVCESVQYIKLRPYNFYADVIHSLLNAMYVFERE